MLSGCYDTQLNVSEYVLFYAMFAISQLYHDNLDPFF